MALLGTHPIEDTAPTAPGSAPAARISFRQPVSTSGFVDAAWWPRSLDLTAELPALLEALWDAGREINRVTYNMHAWGPAPRRIQVEGQTVRLGAFSTSDPLTVRLCDPYGRERIDLLVVPPDTDPDVAERALVIAARADGRGHPGEILDEACARRDVPDTATGEPRATHRRGGPDLTSEYHQASPLDQITAVIRLLFRAGLAMNSIQGSPMSDHDADRTRDALAALDDALAGLRLLSVTLIQIDG